MKIISVKNPWADAIFEYDKNVENRTWRTAYRGRLLIHVSSKLDNSAFSNYKIFYPSQYPHYEYKNHLGMIIGSVELYDCINNSKSEWAQAGMWHWLLKNPQPLKEPISIKGKLGLWEYNFEP
jgi:hypothetical protein